ncbi:MAG: uroporphyrinogen-III synthase [Magnetococcales bacterium]|nr:uroporphyrinogen-III synthase [Magnetococcales bacterium]
MNPTPHHRPLTGRVILITRPQPGNDATAHRVRQLGGEALQMPVLTIHPPKNPEPLQRAMNNLDRFDGVVITSANGARALLAHPPCPMDAPTLYAVGKKSAAPLEQAGYKVMLPPHAADAEVLAKALINVPNSPRRLLILQAEIGRDNLIQHLTKAGRTVTRVVAYRAKPLETITPLVMQALEKGHLDAVLFFSSRSAESFITRLPDPAARLQQVTLAAISPLTARTLQRLGHPPQVIAQTPTEEALLSALIHHWHPQDKRP